MRVLACVGETVLITARGKRSEGVTSFVSYKNLPTESSVHSLLRPPGRSIESFVGCGTRYAWSQVCRFDSLAATILRRDELYRVNVTSKDKAA